MPIIGMMIFAMLVQGGAAAYQASQARDEQKDFMKAQRQSEVDRQAKIETLRQKMKDSRIRTATDRKARLAARSQARQEQQPVAPQKQEAPAIGVTGSYLGGF